jgi:hypothetical protein
MTIDATIRALPFPGAPRRGSPTVSPLPANIEEAR